MPRITPLTRADLPDFEAGFEAMAARLGFVPNSNLIMGRQPELLRAFQAMATAVLSPGKVPVELKALIGHVASTAAGCRYCMAHTGHMSLHRGVAAEKLDAILDYAESPHFTPAERTALHIAWGASTVPNTTTDADFAAAREHWDDDALVEITGVIALYGFLNRWNDTIATELESDPLRFGRERLAARGWEPGKHG